MDRFTLFMLGAAFEVGFGVGLVVRLIQWIVGPTRGRPFSRSVGRPAALAWAVGFATAAFAGAGVMSIGPLVLPFAVLICGVAAWRGRALPAGVIGGGL